MVPGPPDDMSVSLGDAVVDSNGELKCSRHDGGGRRLWVFKDSG